MAKSVPFRDKRAIIDALRRPSVNVAAGYSSVENHAFGEEGCGIFIAFVAAVAATKGKKLGICA